MSVAFTPVEDWANQTQDLIGFNELVLAYSERRQTLGQSAVDPLTAGVSGFDKTLCLAMQEWCEANCTSFIDHVSGPLNAGSTDFLYFTLATWRAAAVLHADGFRRRVEPDDVDSYGTIEVGDARGDWCFEDLQKGFSALRWTKTTGGNAVTLNTKEGLVSSWPSEWSAGYPDIYGVARTSTNGLRIRGQSVIYPTANVARSATVYLFPISGSASFYDPDSYGMVENVWWFFQAFALTNATPLTTSMIGNVSTPPPFPGSGEWGCTCNSGHWLLKWDFTNQG